MSPGSAHRHLRLVGDASPRYRHPPREHPVQYRLRVVLCDIEPAIWRTLEVPSSIELPYLYDVLQIVMGWEDYHLHKFVLGDEPWARDAVSFVMQLSLDEGFDDLPSVNHLELDVRLEELLAEPGESILYLYDFGDDWAHQLTLEAIVGDDISGASCPDGARACPPEDCGGPHGYADLLAILADPGHPEHGQMTAWAGPFDPEHFDRDAINQTLTARTRNRETLRSAAAASALVADLITRVRPPALPALADVLFRADLTQHAAVDDATTTAAMAKIIWMVHHIGDRLKLTGAGYLPPATVAVMRAELNWDGFKFYGTGNRGSDHPQSKEMQESIVALGLARKVKRELIPTKIAAKLVDDPQALWRHVASRVPRGKDESDREGGTIALLALAAGLPVRDLANDLMPALGWRTDNPRAFSGATIPVRSFLAVIGTHPGRKFSSDEGFPDWMPTFARAALQLDQRV